MMNSFIQKLVGSKQTPQAPLIQPNNVTVGETKLNLTYIESNTSFKTTSEMLQAQPVGFSIPNFTTINGVALPTDTTDGVSYTGVSDINVNDFKGVCK